MTPSRTEFVAVIRSPPDTVDDANDFLKLVWQDRTDVTPEDRMALETVLSELVTNVIQNNPHRQVQCEVSLSIRPDRVLLETSDTGDQLDEMPPSDAMPPDLAEHGRGLALIQLMVDSLRYRHDGTRNVWQIQRSRRPGAT
ncbi:MAG TPA: ATP-binding protein [Propionicimonas sp.]|jgi:serine/threonine-protein kinase RsbW|uniref:ATP-binding protein n=1 Tax=Propionicimonas sp. TaxID=1955623 RepID=UPI002F4181FC